MSDNPMLDKVRKLLAKAEDAAATPAEAETYNAKAAALMAEYGIDRALLAAADPSLDIIGDKVVVLDNPYAREKGTLLCSIAAVLGGESVLRTRYPDGVKQLSVHLFGHQSTLERIELLYTSLLLQATTGVVAAEVPFYDNVAAFRRTWLTGFTYAVAQRLEAAEARAKADRPETADGTSTALVLADRSAEVKAAMQEAYPRVSQARTRRLSGTGMAHGVAAGRRANLHNGTGVGGRSTTAIGGGR